MRWSPVLKEKIFDRIESGLLVGEHGAPNGRVTIEADWQLRPTSPVYANSRRAPYRYYSTAARVEHEIPSVQSIRISRNLSQDIATCQITIYNAWHEADGELAELQTQLGKPGYFWPKRGDGDAAPTWNQTPSTGAYRKDGTWDEDFSWRNAIVEDALIRTYQGYGGRPTKNNWISIDDNLANSNILITGVWLVDSVVGSHNGTMTLNCRDVGRLLLDQIVFPPTIPDALYPLEYVPPGRSRFDSLWGPRARAVPSSAYGSRGPVKVEAGNTSAQLVAGDPYPALHPLEAAIDGDIQDFYLSEAFHLSLDGPDQTETAWFELEIPANAEGNVSSVALTGWAGGYRVFGSVMVDGAWQQGTMINGKITENKTVPAYAGEGKDIPYVSEVYIPETNPGGGSQRGEETVHMELRRKVDAQESYLSGLLASSDPREHQRLYGKDTQVEEGELVQFINVQKIRISIQRFYYSGMPNNAGDQYRAGFRTVQVYCLGQNTSPYTSMGDAAQLPWAWNIEPHPTRGYWVLENTGTMHGFGDAADYDSDSPGWDPINDVQSGRRWLPWGVGNEGRYNHYNDPYVEGEVNMPPGSMIDEWNVSYGGSVWHLAQQRAHGMASTPSGKGFWVCDWTGRVYRYGDAQLFSGYNNDTDYVVPSPERTKDWRVDWLSLWRSGINTTVDSKGNNITIDPNWKYSGVLSSTWGTPPRKTCSGIAATHTGNGYWLLFGDGTVYGFGDAVDNGKGLPSYISRGNDPTAIAFRGIQAKYLHYGRVSYGYTKDFYQGGKGESIAAHPKKKGFWVVDGCGQVFAYGEAKNYGGLVNRVYNPDGPGSFSLKLFDYAVDITPTDTGEGYWILFNSGLIASFGDARQKGPVEIDAINKQYESNVAVEGTRFDTFYYRKLFYSMARDQDGRGFWVLRADGEVRFHEALDWGNPGWTGLTGFRWHEGNFDGDYAHIVKDIAMWAGFTYYEVVKDRASIQTTAPANFTVNEYGVYDANSVTQGTLAQYETVNVLGGIETTAIQQDIEITGDKWDKKYCIDVIRELAEVVGYEVYIDQEGGLRFKSPNWWRSGNFDYNGWRIWMLEDSGAIFQIPEQYAIELGAEPYIPVIHEESDLLAYSATLNNVDKRWQIIVGTESPNPKDLSRTAYVQHYPPFANEEIRPGVSSSRLIPRTSMWTSHVFEHADERALMAEMIGIHNYFAGRTGTVTAVANPCLDLDDQVRIVERTTAETYIHRILGIDTEMDLESGSYTMTLQTHWLGDKDNWVLVTTSSGEPWDAGKDGGYKAGARVNYNDVVYISLIDSNTDTPGASVNWTEEISVDNPYVVISDRLDSWQRTTGRDLGLSGYGTPDSQLVLSGAFESKTVGLSSGGPAWGVWVDNAGLLASNDSTTFQAVNYKSFGRGLLWPILSTPPEVYEDNGASYNQAVLRAANQDFILTLGYTPPHLQGWMTQVDVVESRNATNLPNADENVDGSSDLNPSGGLTIVPATFSDFGTQIVGWNFNTPPANSTTVVKVTLTGVSVVRDAADWDTPIVVSLRDLSNTPVAVSATVTTGDWTAAGSTVSYTGLTSATSDPATMVFEIENPVGNEYLQIRIDGGVSSILPASIVVGSVTWTWE